MLRLAMDKRLRQWASEKGYRIAFGGIAALAEAERDLNSRRAAGELDAAFDRSQLASFQFDSTDMAAAPTGIVLMAMPRPAHRLVFKLPIGTVETLLPPTYLRYSLISEELRREVIAAIPEWQGHLGILTAPLKAIASRLGLVQYGRNNVTYIAGLGSYYQLAGYATDVELHLDKDWQPQSPQLLKECAKCKICRAICPTGAITEDRMLLHAERCLTLATEQAGALSAKLPTKRYRCLFGCLECQRACPVNGGGPPIESAGITFSAAETAALLEPDGQHDGSVRRNVRRKLDVLHLTEESLIGRNLRALLGEN